MSAIFKPHKIFTHVRCFPGIIAHSLSNMVPVSIMWINGDHSIMSRTATESTCSRVHDTVVISVIFTITLLLFLITVMSNPKVPGHIRVFRCKSMKCRHAIISNDVTFVIASVTAIFHWIATCFQHNNLKAGLCQTSSDYTTPGARTYYNIVKPFVFHVIYLLKCFEIVN